MRILICGGKGQLGKDCTAVLNQGYEGIFVVSGEKRAVET